MNNHSKGSTLIESVLVIFILSSLVFLISNIPNSFNLISKSKHLSTAREIASKIIEDKRSLSFENIANDNSPITDSRINTLPSGSGEIIIEDCPQAICEDSQPVKQITVKINWKENGKAQQVSMHTLIGKGGLSK